LTVFGESFGGCLAIRLALAAPDLVSQLVLDILLPLMVKRNRVSTLGNEDLLSPIDYVPAPCAAWRFSMLNDNSGLSDHDIKSITVPTLLVRVPFVS
jgi:pimeloyl-ACP methyl ester carboxylesterase